MSLLILGGGGLLFLLFVVVLLLVLIKWKRSQNQQRSLADLYEDPERVRSEIIDPYVNQPCSGGRRPPCGPGKIAKANRNGEMCCYTDISDPSLSTEDKVFGMVELFGSTLITSVVAEKILNSFAESMLKRSAQRKLTYQFTKQTAGIILDSSAKIAARAMVKQSSKMAAKAAMGPIGWALLVLDLTSLALDLWDPMGYNEWQSNTVWKNIRNVSEATFEEKMRNDGKNYPLLVSYLYDDSAEIMGIVATVPTILEFQNDKVNDIFVARYGDAYLNREFIPPQDEFDAAFLEAKVLAEEKIKRGDFDKDICDHLQSQGKPVEWHAELRDCTLTRVGCDQFNEYQKSQPDDERLLGMFTNEYRIRDPTNPGDDKKPNMVTRKLNKPACLVSPLWQNKASCIDKTRSTWNDHAGLCDISKGYCDRMGMKHVRLENTGKHDIHNCELFPGQEFAQFIFGTTITNTAIRGMKEIESTLYLDKLQTITEKYFPMYNAAMFGPTVLKNMVLETADLAARLVTMFGEHVMGMIVGSVRKLSHMGREVIKKVNTILKDPGVMFTDPMVFFDMVAGGFESVIGFISWWARTGFRLLVAIGRQLLNTFKDIGREVLNEFEKIGRIPVKVGEGFVKIFR
jgi:hypothetical protein